MYFTLKKFEKQFCVLETNHWALYGYLEKVDFFTLTFKTYSSEGEYKQTAYISLKEVRAISVGGEHFNKFKCLVSLRATELAQASGIEIKSTIKAKGKKFLDWILANKETE